MCVNVCTDDKSVNLTASCRSRCGSGGRPNNQGEDEFEEADQQQPHEEEEEEEAAPVGHPDMHLAVENQHQPPADEQLVVSDRV